MGMMKSWLFNLIAICMAACAMGATWTDPDTGIIWTYSTSGGRATVGGGRYWSRAVSTSTAGSIAIPDTLGECPVEKIADYAFYGCSKLTDVAIPTNVTDVGANAFNGCSALTNVVLPSGMTSIPEFLFSGCSSLPTVVIPQGVTNIGSSAFYRCGDLSEVKLPDGVLEIGDSAFYNCAISAIDIPSAVTNIGAGAFSGCQNLERLDLPDGIDNVGDRLCHGCTALAACTIPKGVTNIGAYAFCNCSALSAIAIPREVRSIGESAFWGCGLLTKITIPDHVAYVGSCAFSGCPVLASLDFEGRPPEGLFKSFYPSTTAVRYNGAYAVEWSIALSAYAKTEAAAEITATAYAPEGWVSPEEPYEGPFAVSFEAKLQNGHVRMSWRSCGEPSSTPVGYDVLGWRDGGESDSAVTLLTDVPAQYADYALGSQAVAMGTSCRLFAVRYRFADGSELVSAPFDLRSSIPSRIGIVTAGGLTQNVVGLDWRACGYYENPNGGGTLVAGDVPQGWPWSGFSAWAELCGTRTSEGYDPGPVDCWEPLPDVCSRSENRLEYTLDTYAVTTGCAYDMFAIRCQYYSEDGSLCYLYSDVLDLRTTLPKSISISATGSLSNGVVYLSWTAKAQYATGEGAVPAGWPWNQGGWPEIGGIRVGNDYDDYVDYNWSYAGTYPEIEMLTNGCGTAKITLDSARVAMGDVFDRYEIRFRFYSSDSYYGEYYLTSNRIDMKGTFPARIVPVATGTVLEGNILKIAWAPKAYASWEEGAAECAVPEGWPWGANCRADAYGKARGEYAPCPGEWTLMGSDWQKTGTVEVYQNAYGLASGTAPVEYQIRLVFESGSTPYSEYGAELYGPEVNVANVLPGCIRIEAKGELVGGIVNLSWEPHAYVSAEAGAAECDLPEGWPWGQVSAVRINGLRAEGPDAEPSWGMPMSGYDYLPTDYSECSIPLSAYAVAAGTANNVFEVMFEMRSDYYQSYYYSPGILTSTRVDLREQIPGCIRIEATGELVNGTVNLSWEPHAYVSTAVGAAECAVPEGWPWAQASVSVSGEHADSQTVDPYCYMPVYGYEWFPSGMSQASIPLSAFEVAMGKAYNVYRIRYDLTSMGSSYSYESTGTLTSSLVDLRGQIPDGIRVEARGTLDNGQLSLSWEPRAYSRTADVETECAVPAGWPWAQERIYVCGERADSQTVDPNCFMPVYGLEYVYGNSVQIPLSAYEVAMGKANNVYRIRYELMSVMPSYMGMGSLESTLVDLRSQLPGCIRIEATGVLRDGRVELSWMPRAYESSEAGAAECSLPAGWPWMQGVPQVCGARVEGMMPTDSICGGPVSFVENMTDNSCVIPLNAYEVAMGMANNVYEVRYDVMSSPSPYGYGESGSLKSAPVDLRDKIPLSIRLSATASVDAGVVKADWSLAANYGNQQDSTAAGVLPEGWPWDSTWQVRLVGGIGELARDNVAQAEGVLSGALPDPLSSWLSVEMGRDCEYYCLMCPLELATADLTVSSAYGCTSPYVGTTRLVKGAALSLSIDADVYEDGGKRRVLTGWKLEGASAESGTGTTCDFVLAGDTTLTWLWRTEGEDTEPTVADDPGAVVTGDAESGYTITPSEGKKAVEVAIPDGVEADKVTVEIGTDVETVKPNGANVKIVKGANDITDYLDIPAADASGAIDLTQVAVKEEIVKETLDPEKGATIELNAESPTLTTAETKPGLTYTLREGADLGNMANGDSKVGDGQPWTPNITVKGGESGFYSIGVTK